MLEVPGWLLSNVGSILLSKDVRYKKPAILVSHVHALEVSRVVNRLAFDGLELQLANGLAGSYVHGCLHALLTHVVQFLGHQRGNARELRSVHHERLVHARERQECLRLVDVHEVYLTLQSCFVVGVVWVS